MVHRDVDTLFQLGVVAGTSDGQLLERFVRRQAGASEAAFEEIVRRHGPMVLGVCHRELGDRHAAEDAFQATFLVLTLRARSVRQQRVAGALAPRRGGAGGPPGAGRGSPPPGNGPAGAGPAGPGSERSGTGRGPVDPRRGAGATAREVPPSGRALLPGREDPG